MAASLKDALKRAYAKKGTEPPTQQDKPKSKTTLSLPVSAKNRVPHGTLAPIPQPRSESEIRRANALERAVMAANKRRAMDQIEQRKELAQIASAYHKTNRQSKAAQLVVGEVPWTLSIAPDARPHPFLTTIPHQYDVSPPNIDGIAEQFDNSVGTDDVREVVIGLDFGTSSVKVVIGDRAAGHSFAVPFSSVDGIDGYLLPSRLWQTDDHFSLISGERVHRDLKLSLLVQGNVQNSIERATAFLALVIRHVRGWLFAEHGEIYRKSKMVWKLVLGIPAKNYETDPDKPYLIARFRLLAKAAWLVAGESKNAVRAESIGRALSRAQQLLDGAEPNTESEDTGVEVVPELSAQIYGFLKSRKFDRKADNIFMMVDVGAGTIDSSVFHVRPGKRGKWDFEFFTNEVQQNGVMNLHRFRVKWWTDALGGRADPAPSLLSGLKSNSFSTDQHGPIPERMDDYLQGVRLSFRDVKKHPDAEFFSLRVSVQVRGKTLFRARDYLNQDLLKDIPMFLCGGGTRMSYYRNLEEALKSFPGVSWLKAKAVPLDIPSSLEVPGVTRADYDRLSVAFGLSFLEVGKIVRALPKPIVPLKHRDQLDHTDLYI